MANLDIETFLSRFDRTSPQTLLTSIAGEFLRLERAQEALLARVQAMEALQATVDRIVATSQDAPAATFPKKARFAAEDALLGATGLYSMEHDSLGRAYRWTGPEPYFSFPFFFDRRATARFVMRFGGLAAKVPVEGVRAFIDGEEVARVIAQVGDGWEMTGRMPTRLDSAATVLTFICPAVPTQAAAGGGEPRRLGLTFRSLSVEPESETAGGSFDSRPAAAAESQKRAALKSARA